MSVSDHSKCTKYLTYCSECKQDIKIVVRSQRQKPPVACPFCKGDILVESIRTFPRNG